MRSCILCALSGEKSKKLPSMGITAAWVTSLRCCNNHTTGQRGRTGVTAHCRRGRSTAKNKLRLGVLPLLVAASSCECQRGHAAMMLSVGARGRGLERQHGRHCIATYVSLGLVASSGFAKLWWKTVSLPIASSPRRWPRLCLW